MTSITQEYVVIPLNSLKIDLTNTVTNTLVNALPLTSVSELETRESKVFNFIQNMIYDEKEPGVFVLYSMKEMKETTRFETDPFFIVHMINAYDDPNEENTVAGSTN